MKAKHAPVIMNLLDLERSADELDSDVLIGSIKARIARRPGRWRRKMLANPRSQTPKIWEPEFPEAA